MSSLCLLCDRSFPNDTALQQHKRDSPVHADSSRCHDCRRSFRSEDALAQHVRDSPAHAKSFDCTDCCRSFASEDALQQHLRESKAHPRAPETPLDVFFHSFKNFAYDPSQPPATSFAYLQAHKGWRRGDAASAKAWDRYQDALEDEIRLWFGEANDLASWHALCHAIGIEPPPQTCSQCKKAVRRTHVNIVDLIEWGRSRGSNEKRVQTFHNVKELRAYTIKTSKIYRNTFREDYSGNVVLRYLLREIFRGGS